MTLQFSHQVNSIKISATLAIANKAANMKKQGIDVISLGTGEPDFDTPDNIKQAAIKAIMGGKTKYTAIDGITELKEAIVEKFKKQNNLHYSTSQITVGTGAKQVIFNALLATINPGDEVIIPAPYWVSYPEMVTFAQGKSVIVVCEEYNNFKLTAEALEKAITAKTKWLILNSPSNPTGSAYNLEELKQIAGVLLKYPHVQILCDDIYEHILFDGFIFNTLAAVEPKLFDRILTVNGVSKSHSMTGWRIGYAGGSEALIKNIAKVQSQSTSNPCSISQYAALEALSGPQDFILMQSQVFQKRRDLVLKKFQDMSYIKCNKPNGAFYLFPSCKLCVGLKKPDGEVIQNDLDFCEYLLSEASVAVVPGSAFGMPNFFRLSYATSEELLIEACKRIANALNKLKP